ncbi:MAG: hypothetical protein LBU65_07440 [Planctomycetaceae bacterium]|jgi:hypothetical protein|nr:hypothetical protein [Planctomycetaceae bacterium]
MAMVLVNEEIELKKQLVRRIDRTHDVGVLRGLLSQLNKTTDEVEYESNEDVYELTAEEEKEIDEARKTPLITYEEFRMKMDVCLNQLAAKYH